MQEEFYEYLINMIYYKKITLNYKTSEPSKYFEGLLNSVPLQINSVRDTYMLNRFIHFMDVVRVDLSLIETRFDLC